ncbi:MAG: hypothetical protein Kow0025_01600 [Thermodesulfovibrionales bacterium]
MRSDPYIEMDGEFELCPNCGQRVYKGAMRCTRCGKVLITLEEQLARIDRLKKQKRASGYRKLAGALLTLSLAGAAAYYLFSDRINGLVRELVSR